MHTPILPRVVLLSSVGLSSVGLFSVSLSTADDHLGGTAGINHVQYSCPDGQRFSVDYELGRESGGGKAALLVPGKPKLMLPQVESASGVRYSDGFTTVWNKGNEALVESGSFNVSGCKEISSEASKSSGAEVPVELRDGWKLVRMNGGQVNAERPPTMEITADRAAGFAGCNRFTSTLSAQGQRLRFQQTITTKMACIGDGNQLENEFLTALQSVESYEVHGHQLILKGLDGKPLLEFSNE